MGRSTKVCWENRAIARSATYLNLVVDPPPDTAAAFRRVEKPPGPFGLPSPESMAAALFPTTAAAPPAAKKSRGAGHKRPRPAPVTPVRPAPVTPVRRESRPSEKMKQAVRALQTTGKSGYPWVAVVGDKFSAVVYAERRGETCKHSGSVRLLARDACIDAIALRRRFKLVVPDELLARLARAGPLEVGALPLPLDRLPKNPGGFPYIVKRGAKFFAQITVNRSLRRGLSERRRTVYGPGRACAWQAFCDAVLRVRPALPIATDPALVTLARRIEESAGAYLTLS